MIVEVHGLELFGRHGVNDDERRDGQSFLFDVTIEIAEPNEDSIDATVDYRRVRDVVKAVSDAESYRLLETLAAAGADALLAELRPERVRVRVRKPGIAWAEWTGVTCERP
ncbi:MAG: 7,8-dihydroneopterin aldolase/epimerase/oxygenase [Gaiellaceae bacterium]|jgi:dihydroneopterin aldolase|nr:7,8-dihydroneopterin aldolase/epimerase/oxygenase [Gaiellaceae bacterium]